MMEDTVLRGKKEMQTEIPMVTTSKETDKEEKKTLTEAWHDRPSITLFIFIIVNTSITKHISWMFTKPEGHTWRKGRSKLL